MTLNLYRIPQTVERESDFVLFDRCVFGTVVTVLIYYLEV